MKFMFGTIIGMFAGIMLCATYLHTHYFPQQKSFELALMRCDADKTRVAGEVVKIRNYLGGLK